jgi:tetratricopeptide (TPR) repeat protein
MLCRWEHGDAAICAEYVAMLIRLYRASASLLGLAGRIPGRRGGGWYGHPAPVDFVERPLPPMTASDTPAALAAVRESISLALEVDGPAGGPLTVEQLELAVAFYGQQYAAFPPAVLAGEIHRCRTLVVDTLAHRPAELRVRELRRSAGWLSALLGNLAFHLSDYLAAHVHLSTASRLGAEAGDRHLVAWSLGLHAMVARFQGRHNEGVDLADQALEYADTPLRRAQVLAWARLRNLADLGDRDRAHTAMAEARREMDADPLGEEPGRYGFDRGELELFTAEAHLALGEPGLAGEHAARAIEHSNPGRSAWAAASTILGASEVHQGRPDHAIDLASLVLDTIPAQTLREPDRRRLHNLDHLIQALPGQPRASSADLHDRLMSLAPLTSPPNSSPEPNGH